MTTNITDPAEWSAQVVAGEGRMVWTRGELHALFEKVAPENWKDRIDTVVKLSSEWEARGISEAVIFFTGSVPRVTKVVGPHWNGRYRVQAVGYYAAIGA